MNDATHKERVTTSHELASSRPTSVVERLRAEAAALMAEGACVRIEALSREGTPCSYLGSLAIVTVSTVRVCTSGGDSILIPLARVRSLGAAEVNT